MGVSYLIFVLDEEMAKWLRDNNCECPSQLPESRQPTLGELKSVLEQFTDYRVEFVSGAKLDIEMIHKYDEKRCPEVIWTKNLNDESKIPRDQDPIRISFHKSNAEFAVTIVERLTHRCGPLVLVQDLDAWPQLITKGIDPKITVKQWFDGLYQSGKNS